MKLFRKERAVSTAVILCLAAILIILAVLQFRWSREVSDADAGRMRVHLQSSLLGFREDFQRELGSICLPFQNLTDTAGLDSYAEAYRIWIRSAAHPSLVANLYVLTNANGRRPQLVRLNPETGRFDAEAMPPSLGPLPERLLAVSGHVLHMLEDFEMMPPRAREHHPYAGAMHVRGSHRPEFAALWAIEQGVPALVRPHAVHSDMGRKANSASLNWIIVQLDPRTISQDLLPELAERHFSGPAGWDYFVAVLGRNDQIVYSSDASLNANAIQDATAAINLMGGPPGPPGPRGLLMPGNDAQDAGPASGPSGRRVIGLPLVRFDPIHYSADDKDWRLVVRHRKGSLEAVVASARFRNLLLSFGVLAVLAATMALIIANTHRAQRLARSQMDFVAGISHELRTPLAVICSAADNIADGFVDNRQQVVRYGEAIRKQARQLTHLINQVLLFTSTRQNRLQYTLRSLAVTDIVESAMNNTADLLAQAGAAVDRNLDPDLPRVVGDLAALSQCLQNLITNAVKYGGPDRWIGIRAALQKSKDGELVRISVADHGAGIRSSELRQIFEPFYRSPDVIASQIHGTGLGLTLARSVAAAMGGRLSVTSVTGKGSSFHLDLRVVGSAPAVTPALAAPGRSPANEI